MSETTLFTPPTPAPNPFANAKVGEMAPVTPAVVEVEELSSEVTDAREANPKAHVLEISNFQSIKSQVLILQGFVTIQGNSDLGKSSIVRALRALINNDWQPDWLRDGEKLCTISLYLSLDSVAVHGIVAVHLYKSKTRNEYIVEFQDKPAKSYPKIGRDVPQELKVLGLAPVNTDRGDSFNLNVQKQHKSLFLVTNTGTELTSFFNALFQIDRYEKANRTVNSDTMELQRSINFKTDLTQQKDIALKNLQTQLPALEAEAESCTEAADKFSVLLNQAKNITAATEGLDLLERQAVSLQETRASTTAALEYVAQLDSILNGLISVRNGIRILSDLESQVEGLTKKHTEAKTGLAFIESFDGQLGSLAQVRALRETLEVGESSMEVLSRKQGAISSCAKVVEITAEALDKVAMLRKAADMLTSAETELGALKQRAERGQKLVAPLDSLIGVVDKIQAASQTLTPLRNAIRILTGLESDLKAHTLGLEGKQAALDYVTTLLSGFSQYLPVCETCGQNLPNHTH